MDGKWRGRGRGRGASTQTAFFSSLLSPMSLKVRAWSKARLAGRGVPLGRRVGRATRVARGMRWRKREQSRGQTPIFFLSLSDMSKYRDAEQEKALLRARLTRLRSLSAALANPASLASQAVAAYGLLIDEAIASAAASAHREAFGRGQVSQLLCACPGGGWSVAGGCVRGARRGSAEGTRILNPVPPPLSFFQAALPPSAATTPSTASPSAAAAGGGGPGPPPPPPRQRGVANRECLPPPAPPLPRGVAAAATSAVAARVDAFGAPIGKLDGGGGAGAGANGGHVSAGDVACPRCARRVAVSRFAPHLEKCLGGGRQAGRAASRRSYAA